MTASDVDIAPGLPDIMTTQELAAWLGRPPQALVNDRYLRKGVPFCRLGRHVRYLKVDLISYLVSTRWAEEPGLPRKPRANRPRGRLPADGAA